MLIRLGCYSIKHIDDTSFCLEKYDNKSNDEEQNHMSSFLINKTNNNSNSSLNISNNNETNLKNQQLKTKMKMFEFKYEFMFTNKETK